MEFYEKNVEGEPLQINTDDTAGRDMPGRCCVCNFLLEIINSWGRYLSSLVSVRSEDSSNVPFSLFSVLLILPFSGDVPMLSLPVT